MANTYLTTTFQERLEVKALGARWDADLRQWYVPDGRDLAPFAKWLPDGGGGSSMSSSTAVTTQPFESGSLTVPGKKGVSLSSLLAGVSMAVAQAYKTGVWTLVEVVELRISNGHVFLGVSERDAHGTVLAKASAAIWQSTANIILPAFERATGAQLAPGIKLLVRARPVFKVQHGFSLEIDAIDSEYTLGDLEARKREIRERLQAEGVFTANKQLPAPWDFNHVLVVAPEGGAGLGDFQAEANRLDRFGVCRFTYAYSRFQGEGAAKEICDALHAALDAWAATGAEQPDAVAIIRGGGAVNDLAWLNDYDLARYICDLPIPVLTGIGHERDGTVLDEVANTKFDTPSKVIAGIEQVIARRATEAKANYLQVSTVAGNVVQSVRAKADSLNTTIRTESRRHLALGKQETAGLLAGIRLESLQVIRSAAEQSRDAFQAVKTEALTQLADAKRDVPALWAQIHLGTKYVIQAAAAQNEGLVGAILDRARRDAARARQGAEDALGAVGTSARHLVKEAGARSEALMREITGQGPEKTLNRGFALVRSRDGKPVTRAAHAVDGDALEIQFQDGRIVATADKHI